MSSDNFDNEMSKLYQQRKAQVIAPHINLEAPSKNNRLSSISLLGIFSAAGIASFGIMAIISHLSNSPADKVPLYNSLHKVDIAKITPVEEQEKVIAIPQPLPPKPVIKQPKITDRLNANKQMNDKVIEPEILASAQVQRVIVPQLKEPELALKPIYKVLPKYSLSSLHLIQSGEIQLKYQITPAGAVKNISVVKSSVSRKLQQSAKKALAQWQYPPSHKFKKSYEIIFEFKADNG